MACDYANSLGKVVPATEQLSNCWFYGILKRWPELILVCPLLLIIYIDWVVLVLMLTMVL